MRRKMKSRIEGCGLLAAALLAASSGYAGERPAIDVEHVARAAIDLTGRGVRLLERGDARGAAMEFEKVLLLDPANTAAAECLAGCAEAVSCPSAEEAAGGFEGIR
jgi:Tfp pilus assembly protein PilF